ncbi:MAG: ABC transporter ATP-binding protein [Dehalococcoidia bacterium]
MEARRCTAKDIHRPGPAIRVEGLTAGYVRHIAIEAVTVDIPRGAMVGLLGPNGSGKSTLIKTMMGLLKPWEGSVWFDGEPPARARRRIGYMPQAEDVDWNFPVSVRDVVAMGLYQPQLNPLKRLNRHGPAVDDALRLLRVEHLASRQIGELSGGQQRRVLLARALAKGPDILILDEPTAGLDAPSEDELLDMLRGLADAGKTIVVATHDISCVQRLYDYALCLNRRVEAFGPVGEVLTDDVLTRTFGRHLVHVGHIEHHERPHVHHPGST